MGSLPPRPDSLSAGSADYMAGRMGPPKGRVESVFPFFLFSLFFLSPFLFLHRNTQTQNPVFQIPFSLFFLTYTYSYSACLCLSLSLYGLPTLPPSPHLSALGSVEIRTLPRDAKNGDTTSGQRTLVTPPVPPHPLQTVLLPHTKLILNQRNCSVDKSV